MKNTLFIIAALTICNTLHGQDISNSRIQWKVESLVDLKTNSQFAYSCEFETFNDHVEWNQSGGFNSRIDINSASGSWSDTSQDGSITYSVSYEGENGQMVLSRHNSKYTIRIRFGSESNPTLNQEFQVSSVTQIP